MAIDTQALFARYHAAWEAKDAARIASLHSEDSSFILHDGSARVHGRAALEADFAELFRKLPGFGFEMRRTIFGERHGVFGRACCCRRRAHQQADLYRRLLAP